MKSEIRNTDRGRMLFLTDGKTEIGCALDFGIRVSHLSVAGMENICYEQPADCSDGLVTDGGWKLYGGHRIWNTPEDDTCYCPDNDPIEYELLEDGVLLKQEEEPWRRIEKELKIRFLTDGRIEVTNLIRNMSDNPVDTAAWGVNTLSGGDVEVDFIPAEVVPGEPGRLVSLWGDTSITDERLTWSRNHLSAKYIPIPDYFKIGMYTKSGIATYTNKGQKFDLMFGTEHFGNYPDNGCNYELYMNKAFIEMESLGEVKHLSKGECVTHTEYWRITKQ
ncbi:MAG: hypothetical protein Q4E54_05840 [Lachnospiraceae bacterium]|nr:hypothetical protein [Lachnospiraceae bacterium]